jgi:hypothetical protein
MSILDVPGDLSISAGRFGVPDNETAQRIRVGSLIFRGSWKFDLLRGIPLLDQVLGQAAPLGAVREVFRTFLLSTPGVISVDRLDLTLDRKTRILSVSFKAIVRRDPGRVEVLEDDFGFYWNDGTLYNTDYWS